jgi:crotonobetainyl-CoA:carnitine CoA-transferase CaiB-like acyl-CoA transferase
MTEFGQALNGIRVVDIGGSVATGYCGKLFADHGATVIDVEPPDGAATRALAPHIVGAAAPESSALHRWLSTNKVSVTLTIDEPGGQARLLELIESAHVLLSSQPAKALDACNLTLSSLRSSSPNLVWSSISWFGQTGPYASHAGSDAVIQSLAGMVRGIGAPDRPPMLPSGYQAQIIGGLTAFIGTMAQVLAREIGTAFGAVQLDTSILEANLCFTEVGAVAGYQTDLVGKRMGVNRFPPTYPLGIFPCQDGWIGVTVLTPSQWHAFCELLDMNDYARVPQYQTALGRLEAAGTLEPLFAPRLLKWSAEALFHRAQQARIPLALVPTMEQLFSVDQFVLRGAFAAITHTDARELEGPVVPFRLYGTPAFANGVAPRLGEHTEQLIRGAQ